MGKSIFYLGMCVLLVLASCTQKSSPSQGQPTQSTQTPDENGFAIDHNIPDSEISPDSCAGKMVYYGSGTDLQASTIQLKGSLLSAQQPGSTAIVAVPGRFGLSETFKNSLVRFCEKGFSVLAVDLYNQVPTSLADGKTLEDTLGHKGLPDILANLFQAKKFVEEQFQPSQVVVMGWDTGGKWAATAALSSQGNFAAVISYAGNLSVIKEYKPEAIYTPIFGIFAVNDVETSAADMIALGVQYQQKKAPITFQLLQNVQSNFMDPSSTTYQAAATTKALQLTFDFLSGLRAAAPGQTSNPTSDPALQPVKSSGAPF
jgi:dienelactone hydrolase